MLLVPGPYFKNQNSTFLYINPFDSPPRQPCEINTITPVSSMRRLKPKKIHSALIPAWQLTNSVQPSEGQLTSLWPIFSIIEKILSEIL